MAANAAYKVLVASRNPTKINSVQRALERCFPFSKFDVTGVPVPSGVPDQPHGDLQTLQGARNRVMNLQKHAPVHKTPDLWGWVAIEGGVGWQSDSHRPQAPLLSRTPATEGACDREHGIEPDGEDLSARDRMEVFSWVVIRRPDSDVESRARSASFVLPDEIVQRMMAGAELGPATDVVFRAHRTGTGSGTIGRLTATPPAPLGVVTREMYYEHAAIMALAPYMQMDLYPEYNSRTPPPDAKGETSG
ncbi:unnamed protein product [Pedinophyceae sp. YPF-701]|nr:unnamed protein product [Pedinophyceae sp. YPF-701]